MSEKLSDALLYALTAVIAVVIILIVIFSPKRKVNHTKAVVYAAVMVALSFGLSYVRLFSLPLGGSVTLASILPVLLYSYLFGVKRGAFVGVLFGVLNFIQAPFFVHPVQFLLDYPIAFATIGLAGLFFEKTTEKKKILRLSVGTVLACVLRYFAHVISGIFVWGSGDPENFGATSWSFLYNSFVFVDMAVALVGLVALFSSKRIVRFMENIPF